jgi:hypothetical protein
MVVFASDLNAVGEVRRLERQLSKSTGAIKRYNDRAEIRLSRLPQLRDGATMIPSLPKTKEAKKDYVQTSNHRNLWKRRRRR